MLFFLNNTLVTFIHLTKSIFIQFFKKIFSDLVVNFIYFRKCSHQFFFLVNLIVSQWLILSQYFYQIFIQQVANFIHLTKSSHQLFQSVFSQLLVNFKSTFQSNIQRASGKFYSLNKMFKLSFFNKVFPLVFLIYFQSIVYSIVSQLSVYFQLTFILNNGKVYSFSKVFSASFFNKVFTLVFFNIFSVNF